MSITGEPDDGRNILIFNGDFVDRGAWGLELLAVLVAWKLGITTAHISFRFGCSEASQFLLMLVRGATGGAWPRGRNAARARCVGSDPAVAAW